MQPGKGERCWIGSLDKNGSGISAASVPFGQQHQVWDGTAKAAPAIEQEQ